MISNNERPLRILHIASGDLWAGAEVQLYYLAKALHATDRVTLKVLLLNPGDLQQRLLARGITVEVIDEKQHGFFAIYKEARKIATAFNPDIIHTHRYKENILGSFIAKQLPKIHSVRTVHGAQEFNLPWWRIDKRLIQALDQYCGKNLQDMIIAVSDDLAIKLKSTYRPEKITVIENGIDIEEVRQAAKELVTLADNNRIKLAIICRLVPVKRVDIFLNIIELLEQQHPGRYTGYIFGEGPLEAALKRQAENLRIMHCVHFMGFRPNIPAYLNQMDFLLITSDHEGLPMSALESLSLGIPIIAHAVGGLPTLLSQSKYSTLVSSQEPADYIETIVENVSSRSGNTNTDETIVKNSSRNNCDKLINAYLSLI